MNENQNFYQEWREIAQRYVAELQEHLFLERAVDPDGQLRRTARVLDQKRGCRR